MTIVPISALPPITLNGTDEAPVVQSAVTYRARITALPTGSNDNAILRADGTNGFKGQASSIGIDDSGNIAPITTDGGALGTSSLRWSDAFLATGAVLNIGGDWVATHTAGILTIGTGDLRVTTAGTNSASVVTVAGTQTLTNKTLTSPTISSPTLSSPTITGSPTAVGATWANLGSITTIDINGGTVDGTVIGGSSAAAITGTTITGTTITGNSFVPNSSSIPTNGMYLPAANTLGWATNSIGEMQLTSTALSPVSDGGNSLGTTTLAWQNLFGNTGFVFNIEAGNWVATHTTGILTVGTGDLRVSTAGTNSASVVTVDGTQTLTNKSIAIGQITGLGAGVATFLATPSSANLATAVTDETGTGALVFATSPGFTTAANPVSNDGATLGTTALQWSDVFLASGGVINFNNGNVTLTHSANTLTVAGGGLVLAAGTTAKAPLVLTDGTNLTTPAAGAFEYSSANFYATPVASARHTLDIEQWVRPTAVVSLSNSATTPQNIFPSTSDVLTLGVGAYFFEIFLFINTGATTHTTALGLVVSASLTGINYFAQLWSTTAGTISTTAPSVLNVTTDAATVLNATSTATRTTILARGELRLSGAGTITPQITFSAGPTGTCETAVGSYMRIWSMDRSTNTTVFIGNWA